jgi:energy-converting hydrogenase Eha subunit C
MYGALRLQPTNKVMRFALLCIGVLLAVCALQYVLGLGGPFA